MNHWLHRFQVFGGPSPLFPSSLHSLLMKFTRYVVLYWFGLLTFEVDPNSCLPFRYSVIIIITRVFCPKAGLSLQAQELRLQFCRRQIFHLKRRKQGCSFTRDWLGAVASRCFPCPFLSLPSEQTLEIWKDPRGTNLEERRVDLANWALQTPLKVTTRDKYQFHQGFCPDQRSGNPNHPSPLFRYSEPNLFYWVGL